MKKPIIYGRFKLQVHLEGHCWVAPGGKHIRSPLQAERIAQYYAGVMK